MFPVSAAAEDSPAAVLEEEAEVDGNISLGTLKLSFLLEWNACVFYRQVNNENY